MNTNFIAGAPDVVGARSDQVRRRTASRFNEAIDSKTQARMETALSGGRDAVIERLHKLDREIDIDRVLMAYFSVVGTVSLALGKRPRGVWRVMLRAQTGFLLMQSFIGWCPPLVVFRRLGFRTAREIAAERAALVDRLAQG
jgi:hypothetical protein